MGTSFDIIQLERDEKRQWHVVGTVDAMPGGCRAVSPLRPIIMPKQPGSGGSRVGYAHKGHIDAEEKYAYVLWRHVEPEAFEDSATAADQAVVEKGADNGGS